MFFCTYKVIFHSTTIYLNIWSNKNYSFFYIVVFLFCCFCFCFVSFSFHFVWVWHVCFVFLLSHQQGKIQSFNEAWQSHRFMHCTVDMVTRHWIITPSSASFSKDSSKKVCLMPLSWSCFTFHWAKQPYKQSYISYISLLQVRQRFAKKCSTWQSLIHYY